MYVFFAHLNAHRRILLLGVFGRTQTSFASGLEVLELRYPTFNDILLLILCVPIFLQDHFAFPTNSQFCPFFMCYFTLYCLHQCKEVPFPLLDLVIGNAKIFKTCILLKIWRPDKSVLELSSLFLQKFQLWSAYVPCSAQHLDAVQIGVEQIDVIRRLVEKYPAHLTLVTTARG